MSSCFERLLCLFLDFERPWFLLAWITVEQWLHLPRLFYVLPCAGHLFLGFSRWNLYLHVVSFEYFMGARFGCSETCHVQHCCFASSFNIHGSVKGQVLTFGKYSPLGCFFLLTFHQLFNQAFFNLCVVPGSTITRMVATSGHEIIHSFAIPLFEEVHLISGHVMIFFLGDAFGKFFLRFFVGLC